MVDRTYHDLDKMVVMLAHRKIVNLEKLTLSDRLYVTLAANRRDLAGKTIAADLLWMGPEHLGKLIERWGAAGDPAKFDLDDPQLLP